MAPMEQERVVAAEITPDKKKNNLLPYHQREFQDLRRGLSIPTRGSRYSTVCRRTWPHFLSSQQPSHCCSFSLTDSSWDASNSTEQAERLGGEKLSLGFSELLKAF